MAPSKQQALSTHGAFYLPLAVLTGLALSVILPAALSFLIPAMYSALFIFLPQLWFAFLSWVTPPCLFVLLNGIIVVLTASSGMLSSSDSGSSTLGKMENSQKVCSGALMVDSPPSDSYTNSLPKVKDVQKQRSAAASVETYLPASSLHVHTPCVFYDAHGALEAEQAKIFDEDEGNADDEKSSNLSRLGMGSRSFSHVRSTSRIWKEEEEEDNLSNFSRLGVGSRSFSHVSSTSRIREEEEEEEEADNDEGISGLPKLDVVNKSFSLGCRSEPSSPQFVTPSKSNMIKRSLSVDSASFHDNQAPSCSPEDLSDEAFRKRVEDFISKMNAQLRSEAK